MPSQIRRVKTRVFNTQIHPPPTNKYGSTLLPTPPNSSHSTTHHSPMYTTIFSPPNTSNLTPPSSPPRSHNIPTQIPSSDTLPPHLTTWHPIQPSPFNAEINTLLLRSVAYREASRLELALETADVALEVATAHRLYEMQSKCQLYRGLCLMEGGEWREARMAFVKGASGRGWGKRVDGLMREVGVRERRGKIGVPEEEDEIEIRWWA